jgi:hypothetical protein
LLHAQTQFPANLFFCWRGQGCSFSDFATGAPPTPVTISLPRQFCPFSLKHQFSTDFSFSIVRLAKTSTPFSDHCSWIFCAGQIRSVAAIFLSQWIFSPAAIFRLCFPGLVVLLGNFLIARRPASLGIGSE